MGAGLFNNDDDDDGNISKAPTVWFKVLNNERGGETQRQTDRQTES